VWVRPEADMQVVVPPKKSSPWANKESRDAMLGERKKGKKSRKKKRRRQAAPKAGAAPKAPRKGGIVKKEKR